MIYFEMKYETMKICIEEYILKELKTKYAILFIQNWNFFFCHKVDLRGILQCILATNCQKCMGVCKERFEITFSTQNNKLKILGRRTQNHWFWTYLPFQRLNLIAHLLFCYPQLIIRLSKKRTGIHNLLWGMTVPSPLWAMIGIWDKIITTLSLSEMR